MIPIDPNKAAKVGEEWGKTVTDSVFGIVDVVDKHNKKNAHIKAVNEANKGVLDHNKKVDEHQKILKDMAIAEEARAQEIAMLQSMSPAQRDVYHKTKIAAAKAKAKRELQEAESAEEMKQLLQIFAAIFIGFPILIYFAMFMFCAILASTDRGTYREIAPYVPYARAVFGR